VAIAVCTVVGPHIYMRYIENVAVAGSLTPLVCCFPTICSFENIVKCFELNADFECNYST